MKKRILGIGLIIMLALTACGKEKITDTNATVNKETPENETASQDTENGKDTGADAETTKSAKEKEVSDTILWLNGTYGIITSKNGGDLTLFSGYDASDIMNKVMIQKGLKSSWEVTDKKTADDTLKWLLEEGHNKELLKAYKESGLKDFTRKELEKELSGDYSDKDRAYYLGMYDAVADYGDHAILAWDLSRGIQLSSWYYLAGYYTYEEAMESCFKIAKKLQKTYTSWDDMMKSYFYGFQYWNEDDLNDPASESYARVKLYEKLKKEKNSPYALDWKLKLQKDF